MKKVVTSKLIDQLKTTAQDKPEVYATFWNEIGMFIKEGIATSFEHYDSLLPLLRFKTANHIDQLNSLDDYIKGMKPGQDKIYYVIGEDEKSALASPHLEIIRHNGMDALLLIDVIDTFMTMRLEKYLDYQLVNAANSDLDLPEKDVENEEKAEENQGMVDRFKKQLGDRVVDVRVTNRLVESPARLIDQGGSSAAEMQRAYRLLNKEFEMPKKILEINPKHVIIQRLENLPAEDPFAQEMIEQIFDNCLLVEGLHPNPASMISRIQKFMEASLK
jgi:HSP90 family molecular chaperone